MSSCRRKSEEKVNHGYTFYRLTPSARTHRNFLCLRLFYSRFLLSSTHTETEGVGSFLAMLLLFLLWQPPSHSMIGSFTLTGQCFHNKQQLLPWKNHRNLPLLVHPLTASSLIKTVPKSARFTSVQSCCCCCQLGNIHDVDVATFPVADFLRCCGWEEELDRLVT